MTSRCRFRTRDHLERPDNEGSISQACIVPHVNMFRQRKFITEHDAVREILMGLQGRHNLLIQWRNIGDDPWNFAVRSYANLKSVSI